MADTKRSNLPTQSNEDLDRDYPAKERERQTEGDVRVRGTDRLTDGGNAPNPASQSGADEELADEDEDEDELEEEEE